MNKPDQQPSSSATKRSIIITAALVIVIIGAVLLIAAKPHIDSSSQPPAKQTKETPENSGQTEEEQRDYKQEVTVTITADGISPQTLTIPKDTRINWMNTDTVAHKLSIAPNSTVPPQFDNNHEIDPSGGYPYVAHQPITFYYFVADRPIQSGTVVVK
jgi:hypothetical protein